MSNLDEVAAVAVTPSPPYYAVIFTSDGFLGLESAREEVGITVSYWRDMDSILAWKKEEEHRAAQAEGRAVWYSEYCVRIARVERDYVFEARRPQVPASTQ